MTLDATIGGNASNVYATLEESDLYFSTHLNFAQWSDYTKNQKQRAKILAVKLINREKFKQNKASIAPVNHDDYQSLEFPRSYCYDNVGALYIPQEVKDAEAEQAFFILSSTFSEENSLRLCKEALDLLAPHFNRMADIGRM